ncbi:hypothetical protein GRAN_4302 [Granulicella sibirica]|uniref:Uncharacterized protein n=1 Tax=Granulicella sibirica TaxID=2479048 RepID=A0A4Q0SZW8_9BACT|nr:hypothetical protein GRAN_4302 [Granulicella sibirica]
MLLIVGELRQDTIADRIYPSDIVIHHTFGVLQSVYFE